MKKMILSLAFAGSFIMAVSACNSTKSASETTDSTTIDSTITTTPVDTVKTDTSTTTPPDTTTKM